MLKRGTQGSAYWQLLTRKAPETRKALGPITNRPRTTQETLDRVQRVLQAEAPAKPGASRGGRAVPPLDVGL